MANFTRNSSYNPTKTVSIINAEICESFTIYIIEITINKYKWQIKRRYNDFCQLHEKLCEKFKSLNKSILPRKKLFGNNKLKFVKQRQSQLETYLQIILKCLTFVPSDLSIFLEFNKYEIHGIIHTLSEKLYDQSDILLSSNKPFLITQLQLHALTQRLLLAEPTCDGDDIKRDIGHLLDFVTRVKHLQINGSILPCGTSNIIMNELLFNISNFKSLISLRIFGANLKCMDNVDHIKNSVTFIRVGHCLEYIKDFLLIGYEDGVSWHKLDLFNQSWTCLLSADFSQNRIASIDESIRLAPNLRALNLNNNQLTEIKYLQHLIQLETIDLSYNNICALDKLNVKFGNISTIIISHNKLDSLRGFAKLYSLIHLDVSYNKLSQINEIRWIQNLPCLVFLDMRNNSVQATIDYKLIVLEWFADRVKELCLDGKKVTSQEAETVAIRFALKKSNLGSNKEELLLNSINSIRNEVDEYGSDQIISSSVINNEKTHNLEINWVTGEKPIMCDLKDFNNKHLNVDTTKELNSFSYKEYNEDNEMLNTVDFNLDENYLNKSENSSYKTVKDAFGFKRHEISSIDYSNMMCKNTSKSLYFLLPETLPGVSCKKLIAQLTRLMPEREGLEGEIEKDVGILVVWCMAIFVSDEQKSEFPACIYLMGEYVYLNKVLNPPTSNYNIPKLSHMASFSFKTLMLLVSQNGSYIQVFNSEKPNIYVVLLMQSAIKSDYFIEMVKKAKRKNVPDLDSYEDPIILRLESLKDRILPILIEFESVVKDTFDFMLTNLILEEFLVPKTFLLVFTQINLYIFEFSNFIVSFKVIENAMMDEDMMSAMLGVFPLNSRIINIQLYDAENFHNQSVPSTELLSCKDFIGYGISLSFHLGQFGIQKLNLRWPTSYLRDKFISNLTYIRSFNSKDKNNFNNSLMIKDHCSDIIKCDKMDLINKNIRPYLSESDLMKCDENFGNLKLNKRLNELYFSTFEEFISAFSKNKFINSRTKLLKNNLFSNDATTKSLSLETESSIEEISKSKEKLYDFNDHLSQQNFKKNKYITNNFINSFNKNLTENDDANYNEIFNFLETGNTHSYASNFDNIKADEYCNENRFIIDNKFDRINSDNINSNIKLSPAFVSFVQSTNNSKNDIVKDLISDKVDSNLDTYSTNSDFTILDEIQNLNCTKIINPKDVIDKMSDIDKINMNILSNVYRDNLQSFQNNVTVSDFLNCNFVLTSIEFFNHNNFTTLMKNLSLTNLLQIFDDIQNFKSNDILTHYNSEFIIQCFFSPILLPMSEEEILAIVFLTNKNIYIVTFKQQIFEHIDDKMDSHLSSNIDLRLKIPLENLCQIDVGIHLNTLRIIYISLTDIIWDDKCLIIFLIGHAFFTTEFIKNLQKALNFTQPKQFFKTGSKESQSDSFFQICNNNSEAYMHQNVLFKYYSIENVNCSLNVVLAQFFSQDKNFLFNSKKIVYYSICFAQLALDSVIKRYSLILFEDLIGLFVEDILFYPIPDFMNVPHTRMQFHLIDISSTNYILSIDIHNLYIDIHFNKNNIEIEMDANYFEEGVQNNEGNLSIGSKYCFWRIGHSCISEREEFICAIQQISGNKIKLNFVN